MACRDDAARDAWSYEPEMLRGDSAARLVSSKGVFEVAGVRLRAPMMRIHTVAAGVGYGRAPG